MSTASRNYELRRFAQFPSAQQGPLGRKNALLIQVGRIGKSCIYTGNGTNSGTQLLQALGYLDVKSDGKFVIVTRSQKGQMFLDETKEKPYAHGAEVAGFRKHVTY